MQRLRQRRCHLPLELSVKSSAILSFDSSQEAASHLRKHQAHRASPSRRKVTRKQKKRGQVIRLLWQDLVAHATVAAADGTDLACPSTAFNTPLQDPRTALSLCRYCGLNSSSSQFSDRKRVEDTTPSLPACGRPAALPILFRVRLACSGFDRT